MAEYYREYTEISGISSAKCSSAHRSVSCNVDVARIHHTSSFIPLLPPIPANALSSIKWSLKLFILHPFSAALRIANPTIVRFHCHLSESMIITGVRETPTRTHVATNTGCICREIRRLLPNDVLTYDGCISHTVHDFIHKDISKINIMILGQ